MASLGAQDREGQVHDHVGALDEVAHARRRRSRRPGGTRSCASRARRGRTAGAPCPTMRLTARERSSASTMPRPRSPVGPVTATVRPVVGMCGFYPIRRGAARVRRASQPREQVDGSAYDACPARRRSCTRSRLPSARRHRVVARAGVDRVGPAAAGDLVVERARADAVAAAAALDLERPPTAADHVVAGAGQDRHVAAVGADRGPRPSRRRRSRRRGSRRCGRGRSRRTAGRRPACPNSVSSPWPAEHEVGAGARVDHVVAGARVDPVVAGARR